MGDGYEEVGMERDASMHAVHTNVEAERWVPLVRVVEFLAVLVDGGHRWLVRRRVEFIVRVRVDGVHVAAAAAAAAAAVRSEKGRVLEQRDASAETEEAELEDLEAREAAA